MPVVLDTFYAPPFIVAGAIILLTFISVSIILRDAVSGLFASALASCAALLVLMIWPTAHTTNVQNNATNAVEAAYDMTIIKGGVPLGDTPRLTPLVVYLNDMEGPQACILETTEDATYELTCNGEVREPNLEG